MTGTESSVREISRPYRRAAGVAAPDIRLIATDMDGTLLDDENQVHADFWPMIKELRRRGIHFSPASGRQYYSIRERLEPIADDITFVAENGTFVVQHDRELSSDCLTSDDARRIIEVVRRAVTTGVDAGLVVCGKRSAYIDRTDQAFVDEISQYMVRLEAVPDLLAVLESDEILKVSIFDVDSAEHSTYPVLREFHDSHLVTVSGDNWVDITSRTANKGHAIRQLQQRYGITPAQTMVFGDFLNDLEMMDTADYSFAMHNAHPELKARARYIAPSNQDNGVVRTISAVLDLPWA